MTDFFYDSCFLVLRFLIPGIFLGALYDIFRFIRIARNDKTYALNVALKTKFRFQAKNKCPILISEDIILFIEDLLFFIIAAITEILAVYDFNNGEIRIYCLLFSVIGFIFYQKTIGHFLISVSRRLLYLYRRLLYFFACMVLIPIFFFLKFGKKLLKYITPAKEKNVDRV